MKGGVDRREMIAMSGAAAALAGAKPARAAPAPGRGTIGDYRRLPALDDESRMDFLWGVEKMNAAVQAPASTKRAKALLARAGRDPAAAIDTAEAVALLGPDPLIAANHKTYLEAQRMKMRVVRAALGRHEAHYLDLLAQAESRGPGSLKLDPAFRVPDYARHELHMQPGGYVGDPLAGFVFRYAIVGLYSGHNFQNESHNGIAQIVPVPADGQVRRVLELGCGIGQLATALQQRHRDAEIWGVDTSAPMLRYAHLRATELGSPVHFAQQSAEQLRFPDRHFDVVTASGLFHEIDDAATRAIIGEVARVLRPGGTFYPLDLHTAGPPGTDGASRFAAWVSYRWYHEDWRIEYAALDLAEEMRRAGLAVREDGPGIAYGGKTRPNMMATRPA